MHSHIKDVINQLSLWTDCQLWSHQPSTNNAKYTLSHTVHPTKATSCYFWIIEKDYWVFHADNILEVTCKGCIVTDVPLYSVLFLLSRHTVVCQRPRKCEKIKIRTGTTVCYLRDRSSSRFQPIITQKLWRLFLLILHILMSPYTAPYIPNLRGIAPAVPEIRAPETSRILFVFFFFFFFAPNN